MFKSTGKSGARDDKVIDRKWREEDEKSGVGSVRMGEKGNEDQKSL